MYRGLTPHKITPMSGVLHAKPRAARLFLLASRSPRPVIVDVITLNQMPAMTYSSKTGHLRWVCALVSFGGIPVSLWLHTLATKQWPNLSTLFTILFALALLTGGIGFFVAMCRWRTQCPKCCDGTARFTYNKQDFEYLTCDSCGYSEATGYTQGE